MVHNRAGRPDGPYVVRSSDSYPVSEVLDIIRSAGTIQWEKRVEKREVVTRRWGRFGPEPAWLFCKIIRVVATFGRHQVLAAAVEQQ